MGHGRYPNWFLNRKGRVMHILHVIGARPNFMKVAPVMGALSAYAAVHQTLVHTGQHYDVNMSDVFFQQLGLPEPDANLGVGSGSHAEQTAQVMLRFEDVVLTQQPDLVLVYGDVNSTLAASLVCAKLGIRVGHVEAGLRAFDRTMPEEINRVLTDQLADLLFTPSSDGDENLMREGIDPQKVHLVGNVMIDTLIRLLPSAMSTWRESQWCEWEGRRYVLTTLHRPSNVDDPEMLQALLNTLGEISREIPVIFPLHPRTRQRFDSTAYIARFPQVHLAQPLGYLEFLALQKFATAVITDSGGVQEETTYLGIPCLTVRNNTERPVTVTVGTNILVGQDMQRLLREVGQILSGGGKRGQIPPLWDGCAGERIAAVIVREVE